MDTNLSNISQKGVTIGKIQPKKIAVPKEQVQPQQKQMASSTSSAITAMGMAQIYLQAAQRVAKVQETPQKEQNGDNTINLFYFSDTHGELNGLTKIAAAKEVCEECCGGEGHMTVLGSGDLVAGKQAPVIQATVQVVNKIGMEANALGNHERDRSDEKLAQLNADMTSEFLAINATESDKSCSVIPSKICKQGDMEFITIGAKPLSPVDNPADIATAIDAEVARVKAERREQGLSDDLPVVFLSHMGSGADKVVAENSESVDVILGGHSHNVEEFNFTGKTGKNVHVVQGGKNNEYVTVVQMKKNEDGTISASSKKIDIKASEESICEQVQSFYGSEEEPGKLLQSAQKAEQEVAEVVAAQVGAREDLAIVKEGYGFENIPEANGQIRERNFSNPVSNIMADAMLGATKSLGVQVSLFNAPAVKDTEVPKGPLTNYDVIGRMLPFGGQVVMSDVPVEKLYEMIEYRAQGITSDDSQLMQVGGMIYSVDAEKAQVRYSGRIAVMQAAKDLSTAEKSGNPAEIAKAKQALEQAKEQYEALPGCVEKILLLNDDGTETKINPKAIKRGDFNGMTIRCVMNDFLADETGVHSKDTGHELSEVFKSEIRRINEENNGDFFVDQNEVRISVKDKNGVINGYEPERGVNTKYWY
ncbi:MAG: 5'-nucleotidase C-terminal domain-containing protein [Candidatus Gastranaerophilales bacterium]|nr:5'-nucleotidase C-terminal domain-containing protein [Candidatus Gastranaerophilales bacterium]